MLDTGDLSREVARVIEQCREIESNYLRDLNAPITSVPYRIAQAIMLGRILSRADSDLARLIIDGMQSTGDDVSCDSTESSGFNLEHELATFSARFEWKRLVSELKDSGADCQDAFWAGYQFHADLMEKLASVGEPRSEEM